MQTFSALAIGFADWLVSRIIKHFFPSMSEGQIIDLLIGCTFAVLIVSLIGVVAYSIPTNVSVPYVR